MRKRILIPLACTALLGMILLVILNTPEKRTIRYFERHKEALAADAAAYQSGTYLQSNVDVIVNCWDGEHSILEYIVVGSGTVSAAKYYGFFYSPDDLPASFQNAGVALKAVSEDTWEWYDSGDNHGVVTRMEPTWFYFEAAL